MRILSVLMHFRYIDVDLILTIYLRIAGAAGHRAGDGGEAGRAAPGADAAHRAEAQHRRPRA